MLKIKKLKFHQQKLGNKENYLEVEIININSLNKEIFNILDSAKAEDIKIIDLKNKSSIADFFVIATCRSTRHSNATAEELIEKLKNYGIKCPSPEGLSKSDWVIVDAGTVIVHLFLKEIRKLYSLEKLWDINFDSYKTNKTKLANLSE